MWTCPVWVPHRLAAGNGELSSPAPEPWDWGWRRAARGPSRALPSHKTHPSASYSKMLLPQFGTLIILITLIRSLLLAMLDRRPTEIIKRNDVFFTCGPKSADKMRIEYLLFTSQIQVVDPDVIGLIFHLFLY